NHDPAHAKALRELALARNPLADAPFARVDPLVDLVGDRLVRTYRGDRLEVGVRRSSGHSSHHSGSFPAVGFHDAPIWLPELNPPSTTSTCPVMNAASSDARNRT